MSSADPAGLPSEPFPPQTSAGRSRLPQAPASAVDDRGAPNFGAFAGHLPAVSWDGLRGQHDRGRIWRFLHEKKWHYASVAGPRVVVAAVVADLGWTATAWAYVFDRATRTMLFDKSFMGVQKVTHRVADRAGDGARTTFQGLGASMRIERPQGSPIWRLQAEGPGGFLLDASLDATAAPETLLAIAPLLGGVANATHKTVNLPARGEVRAGGKRFDLDGHFGSLDHTSGLLARDTSWRWASASGARVGLNLVEGFNGPVENVLWLDGQPLPAGEAVFEFDKADHSKPWKVRTKNGMLDLVFTPEGARREDVDLVVAKSWYVQPIGTFSGTVRAGPGAPAVEVKELVGVTEDHVAKW